DGAGWVYIEGVFSFVMGGPSTLWISRRRGCLAQGRTGCRNLCNDDRMRPPVLNPLFASLTSLSGVGPKLEKLYARLLDREAPRVVDLLFHLPSGTIDRRARPKLRDVQP